MDTAKFIHDNQTALIGLLGLFLVTGCLVPLWNECSKRRDRAHDLRKQKIEAFDKPLHAERIKATQQIAGAAAKLVLVTEKVVSLRAELSRKMLVEESSDTDATTLVRRMEEETARIRNAFTEESASTKEMLKQSEVENEKREVKNKELQARLVILEAEKDSLKKQAEFAKLRVIRLLVEKDGMSENEATLFCEAHVAAMHLKRLEMQQSQSVCESETPIPSSPKTSHELYISEEMTQVIDLLDKALSGWSSVLEEYKGAQNILTEQLVAHEHLLSSDVVTAVYRFEIASMIGVLGSPLSNGLQVYNEEVSRLNGELSNALKSSS